MLSSVSTPWSPSVVLQGYCDLIVGAALAFRLMNWDVRLQCPPEHAEWIARRLDLFELSAPFEVEPQSEGSGDVGEGILPRVIVFCGVDAPDTFASISPEVLAVELVGTRVDNGADSWKSCANLISYMRSGQGILTRERGEEGLRGTPYLVAGSILPSLFVGLHAVMLATATIDLPEPPKRISLSAQECLLSPLHNAALFAQTEGRDTARGVDPPAAGGRFNCSDGAVLVSAPSGDHWEKIIGLLGNPAWSRGDWWRDAESRFANRDLLNPAIGAWCAARTKADAFVELQEAGIPAAYVAAREDVLANEQLRSRGFFAGTPTAPRVRAPYAATFAETPAHREWGGEPPPAAAPQQEGSLPLDGLRICDLSWVWAGPYLTMHAAMLGATVVKVENRARIDTHREVRPYVDGDLPAYERAAGHLLTNRNKFSLEVDFKTPEGLKVIRDLIASSDALVANFSPGVLDRIGLGFDEVAEIVGARGFVYLSLSGFGATGPWSNYRALGAHLAELTGLTTLTGLNGLPPISMGIPFGDPLAGTFGAAALLSSLQTSRARSAPVFLDISQLEVLAASIADAIVDGRRRGNVRDRDHPGSGVYRCAGSDNWVAVKVGNADASERLARLLSAAGPDDIVARVSTWAGERSCEEAARLLRAVGADATEVLSAAELLGDRSLRSSAYWVPGSIGGENFLMQGAPWLIDGRRLGSNRPAPLLGQHTNEVLIGMLGYPSEQASIIYTE